MITFSQIPLSEIELGRMDAEYYRPELVMLAKSISTNPHVSIRRAGASIDCSAFYPSIVPYYDFKQNGVPFLRVNEIQNGLLSIDEKTAFLPEEILHVNRSTIATCEPGDLIIAKGGNSLGKVALLTSLYSKYSVCRDVLVVRTGNLSQINRFFLWLYLHSASGQSLLIRTASQTGQPHLTIESIARLKIPLIPNHEQEEIERSYLAAEAAMEIARSAYIQAQQLLESELGLDKLRFDKPVGYTARFSELELSLRFDPEHFYPTFKALCAGLPETVSLEPLYRFAEPLKTGIQPTYLEDGEYEVINSKHIGVNKIDTSKLRRAAPASYSVMADNGDVLLNATGRGTLGRCAVLETDIPRIFDVCIIRIRPIGIDPYFLSALLNTRFGQLQMELHTRGTSGQLHLYPRDARKILIWPAPESLQAEVRELMTKAARSAQEATRLLEQAKFRVEQLIEEAVQA